MPNGYSEPIRCFKLALGKYCKKLFLKYMTQKTTKISSYSLCITN